jgi:hypothetical protein
MKLKDLDGIEFKKPLTVAVYRKTKGSKKFYMLVTTKSVDIVNNARAQKPLIDHKYEITDLGIGQAFIERWMKSHKITNFDFVE